MHRKYNEDLFESTKMTFGEHLEELRRSLFKAVLALMIGFGIALVFLLPALLLLGALVVYPIVFSVGRSFYVDEHHGSRYGEFVQDEATRAQHRHVYVPVLIDKVHLPLGFGEMQALPLVGWKGDRADPRYQAVLAASTTHGKNAEQAKRLELEGWDYPKHLAGRAFAVVVHGDVGGAEETRRALCDWLGWMQLVKAGGSGGLDRFIGYYEPYATSHDALDRDEAVQAETRNAALALVEGAERPRVVPGALRRDPQACASGRDHDDSGTATRRGRLEMFIGPRFSGKSTAAMARGSRAWISRARRPPTIIE